MSVQIRVIRGTNISVIDGLSGKVDPYVSITTGHEYAWKTKAFKTKVCPRNRNPVWDQVFLCNVLDVRQDVLQVTVWDHSALGQDTMIGQARVPLQNLPQGVEQIMNVTVNKAGKHKGSIELGVKAMDFGVLPQVTVSQTTTTYENYPPPTTYIQQQYQQPVQPYQTVQQQYQQQPVMYAQVAQVPVYEQTIDNNTYMAYNGMLYGNSVPTAPGGVPQYLPDPNQNQNQVVYAQVQPIYQQQPQ